jgi:hypothetical protein
MIKKKPKPAPEELKDLKKGSLLVIKTPPYYTKEYLYEVTSAGDKLIRASLYHSPTVKKSWTKEELAAMLELKVIRLATEQDVSSLSGPKQNADCPDAATDGDSLEGELAQD